MLASLPPEDPEKHAIEGGFLLYYKQTYIHTYIDVLIYLYVFSHMQSNKDIIHVCIYVHTCMNATNVQYVRMYVRSYNAFSFA